MNIQLTLEKHGCELHKSTYMQNFFNKFIQSILLILDPRLGTMDAERWLHVLFHTFYIRNLNTCGFGSQRGPGTSLWRIPGNNTILGDSKVILRFLTTAERAKGMVSTPNPHIVQGYIFKWFCYFIGYVSELWFEVFPL